MAGENGQTLTVTQAAALIGKSERYIQLRAKEGYFEKEKHGSYPLIPLVRGVIQYQDEQIAKANKSAAASRVTDARTREIELRIAEKESVLIKFEDAQAVIADLLGLVRSEISSIPAKVTRDMDQRGKIEEICDGTLNRIAGRAGKAAAAVSDGSGLSDGEAEADTGGVGQDAPEVS